MPSLVPPNVLEALSAGANVADTETTWPGASWDVLRRGGVLTWGIPAEHGGRELAPAELLEGYAQLGGACLTTCFILSQREAAVSRIRAHGNPEVQRALLPGLARGEQFTTVGLSQLTTSRQHGKPAMAVREAGDRLVFDGVMPWVTGAPQADYFITGGVLPDGRQVLAVLHRDTKGVRVPPPLDLMSLQGSLTGEVVCENVEVERRWLLAGPAERVLATGSGGAGGLMTSCLALGLIGAATSYLLREAAQRPELRGIADRQEETRQALWNELLELSRGGTPERMIDLRGKANTLVLQATQTALTASKGTGFLRNHPAQRWARQALFFLVWSCPRPATEATLAYLTPAGEHDHVCL